MGVMDEKSVLLSSLVWNLFYLFRGDRRFEKPGRKDVGKAFQLFEVFFICTSMVFVLTEAHRQYLY